MVVSFYSEDPNWEYPFSDEAVSLAVKPFYDSIKKVVIDRTSPLDQAAKRYLSLKKVITVPILIDRVSRADILIVIFKHKPPSISLEKGTRVLFYRYDPGKLIEEERYKEEAPF
jgi:hypothetical protein